VQLLELDLDVYQGPFDLLLSLILKEEVDLLEVPLHEIILAYLDRLEAAEDTDWEDLTEFLLVMSLLLEVKSRLLLPGTPVMFEEQLTPDEARDELVRRLLTYGKFKAAAERLRGLGVENARTLLLAPAGAKRRTPPPLDQVAASEHPRSLCDALERLLAARRPPETSHIVELKVQFERQVDRLRELLSRGRFSFDKAFGQEQPLVQALSLFALLDLISNGEAAASQSRPFGDISVRPKEAIKTA
jgi:segregation and condensation protein A